MTYYNLSGVPIDVNKCFPQLKEESEAAANEINEVIDRYPQATGELSQRFEASMQAAAGAGLCPFVSGTGPIIEESNAVLELARAIAANPPPPPTQDPGQVAHVQQFAPGQAVTATSPAFLSPEQSFTEQSFPDDTFIPTKKKLGKLPIVIGLLLLGGVGIGFWLIIK